MLKDPVFALYVHWQAEFCPNVLFGQQRLARLPCQFVQALSNCALTPGRTRINSRL